MRPFTWPAAGEPPAFAAAMNLLVPWSNRVSGGGFEFGGRTYELHPNLAGEPFPIHGDAWLSEWSVETADGREAILAHDGAIGPYRYRASVRYAILDGVLDATLSVRALQEDPLPYGLGFHPWFVRRPGTTLEAASTAMWREDERHLPAGRAGPGEAHDFRAAEPLPDRWVNNGFDGWDGRAVLRHSDGSGVRIDAVRGAGEEVEAAALGRFVLYSPAGDAPFACFEPVSHAIDAYHLPGGPLAHGMVALARGEALSASCRFTPFAREAKS